MKHGLSFTMLAMAVLLALVISQPAFARMKKVKGANISKQLEKCNLLIDQNNDDDHWTDNANGTECCAKKYGYCIYCPKTDADFDDQPPCNKIPYRTISTEINKPGGDTLAPVPDTKVPSRPGTAPKLQPNAGGDTLAPAPDTKVQSRPGTAPKLQLKK